MGLAQLRANRPPAGFWGGLFLLTTLATSAQAGVQRSFVNGSFELPALASSAACWTQVPDSVLPGWNTSHTSMAPVGGTCPAPLAPATGKLIELWANSNEGVTARSGKVFAELNAEQNSTLSQSLCLNNGEQVSWSLSHRGRSGADQMNFYVGDDSAVGMVLDATTDTAGATAVNACETGSSITASGSCTAATATVVSTQWGDYSGSFTWTGAAGPTAFNFAAIASAGGNITYGNFLDNISVRLTPFIEFSAGSGAGASGSESVAAVTMVGIKVSGEFTTAQDVSVTITGGTATLGADYTTPNGLATFNVTIPAGAYDGSTTIPIGIAVSEDALIEGNETVTMQINPDPAYQIQSTSICGGAQNATTTYTILDKDSIAAPLASSDAAIANFNTPVTLSAWSNDTAPNGSTLDGGTLDLDPATAGVQTSITVAGQGTFVSNNDGTVTFTPVAGFSGVVAVPYTISDSQGRLSNQATITVTVRDLASSSTPVAGDDFATTTPSVAVNISVLDNDTAGTGNTLIPGSVVLSGMTPAQGSWSVDGAGVVTFTPAVGFIGIATATYTVADSGSGVSNTATISVTVATGSVSSVPTLSEWGMILLSLLLALTTFRVMPTVRGSV
jgi:hypothetical protein